MLEHIFKHFLWLGMRDSNPRCRDQNPVPYHLANPQRQELLYQTIKGIAYVISDKVETRHPKGVVGSTLDQWRVRNGEYHP